MLVAWQRTRTVSSCISVATRWYSSASLGKLWFGVEGRNRMSLRIVWYFICNTCRPLSHILQAPYLHLMLCSATLCSRQCRRCRRCNALSVTLSVTQRSSKITHSRSLNHSFIDLLLYCNSLSLSHSIARGRLPLPSGRPSVLDPLGNLLSPARICRNLGMLGCARK